MRIAVAMSGGVDSSVAAALLVEQGHEVLGLTLKVWEDSRCCSLEDVDDARRVARRLGLPFYVLDARCAFEEDVIGPFVEGYRRGHTPNPCILCNRRIKFRWLAQKARALGCELLATGHYARLDREGTSLLLRKGVDPLKDQSYFLVPGDLRDLERVVFPLGGLTKEAVRALASEWELPVAAKTDSQDLCFLPEGGLASFFEARLGTGGDGDVVDQEGRVLGRHDGIHSFTVGQRKGLGVAAGTPLYVVRKEPERGRLVVGSREELMAAGLGTGDAVWLSREPPSGPIRCRVKIRSTSAAVPCTVEMEGRQARVRFRDPQFGVAPGQMAVFYDGDVVLGGAWIEGPS